MKTLHTALLATALIAGLAGCQRDPQPKGAPGTTSTWGVGDGPGDGAGDSVSHAMDHARTKLAAENIKISEGDRRAEISPRGDLIIDGRNVPVNEDQRRLLLDYRAQVIGIANAGMDIGVEGTRLASKAVTEAISGIFSGNPDRVSQRVEAQAQGIKVAASKLCEKLPAMYASQRRVADAVPEFAPFAKQKPDKVSDCKKDLEDDAPAPAAPVATAPAAPPAPAAKP